MIASSFGKLQKIDKPLEKGVDKNDVARSLLTMVSVNTLMLSKMIA
jgi:pantothenate kinase